MSLERHNTAPSSSLYSCKLALNDRLFGSLPHCFGFPDAPFFLALCFSNESFALSFGLFLLSSKLFLPPVHLFSRLRIFSDQLPCCIVQLRVVVGVVGQGRENFASERELAERESRTFSLFSIPSLTNASFKRVKLGISSPNRLLSSSFSSFS